MNATVARNHRTTHSSQNEKEWAVDAYRIPHKFSLAFVFSLFFSPLDDVVCSYMPQSEKCAQMHT